MLTLASFPFLYISLDLPKTIINHAIRDDAKFPQYVLGFEFDRIPYLMLLCGAFLLTVLINGAFKYCINTYKGQLGERMLRRFRYQLYLRLLRFPLTHFQKTSSAQIIPMVTAECESLGGFIGDALALPAFQGGTLLTIICFMFMQDPVLGARRGRALSVPGLHHPETAAQGEPARQAAGAHRSASSPTGSRNRRPASSKSTPTTRSSCS